MEDITIIFSTLNKLPKKWQAYQKEVLLEAIGDTPIITLSRDPLDWGLNVIQTEPEGMSNIFFQILKGARLATTPYIGIAEDDTLYPKAHFEFRPPLDTFAYNRTRWTLFTWGKPVYYYKPRSGNCVMIAPRQRLIEALDERFGQYPVLPCPCEPGNNRTEDRLGLKRRKHVKFYTIEPVVNFNHKFSHNPVEQKEKKKGKPIRAFDIPKWGRADELVRKFYG